MAKFWTSQELNEILTKASPHVRYLLWELFVKSEVPKDQLESKPVALAIVQRLSRSKGKDSLVLSESNGNGAIYRLNPEYLEDFRNLLSKDLAPEKPKPKPKENKPVRGMIVSTSQDDTEGGRITLTSTSTTTKAKRGPKGKRGRKADSNGNGELELPLTEETNFQFWFEFVRKINVGTGSDLTIISNGESALLRIP
ncbi:MAG: hypothetical protein KJ645_07450 [Planctomycetes bacterium]|nr:hypothetical protein [Planctomycetota bacterium]